MVSEMSDKILAAIDTTRQYWPESFDPQTFPLRLFLLQVQLSNEERMSRVLAANGLSLIEFSALASLRRTPPPHVLTPSEMQQSMLITYGGLTKVLSQLEAKGLVVRPEHDGDRRVKPVALTAKALPMLEKLMADLRVEVDDWLGRALTGDEIEQLTALLSKLAHADED